ncbi:MAG: hypothetical protein L6R39_001461 [Caloplaca ligustica]|nr:MAG: hypothetical protein L6R39_001461 [Caloplaca ligustica]
MSSLPTKQAFFTSLFASFQIAPPPSADESSNPLVSAPPTLKSLLLTLHVLFPNELLPALDLLDRKLVTRLRVIRQASAGGANAREQTDVEGDGQPVVYYVRSSQQTRSSRFSSGRVYDAFAVSGQHYEVRFAAWNCSCPAFALAWVACMEEGWFERLGRIDHTAERRGGNGLMDEDVPDGNALNGEHRCGGLMRGDGEMPVCKHLLACLLAESGGGCGNLVEERAVGREEMSGWAAGWGG